LFTESAETPLRGGDRTWPAVANPAGNAAMGRSTPTPSARSPGAVRRSWIVIPPQGAEHWILRDSINGTEWRFATQREALRFALFQAADPLHASVASAGSFGPIP
jgi:hypothetical protein